jgi:hypothetical protein
MKGSSNEQSSEGIECIALGSHRSLLLMSAARLLHNVHLQWLTPFISVAILMGFAIMHGMRRYGWRHFVVFFILTFVISWSYETSSILTGFPFGHYVYTDKLGPKLWLVPLLIMPAYFSMGYIAWTLGHVRLAGFRDLATSRLSMLAALPLIGHRGHCVSNSEDFRTEPWLLDNPIDCYSSGRFHPHLAKVGLSQCFDWMQENGDGGRNSAEHLRPNVVFRRRHILSFDGFSSSRG